jgi:hypothetical protein
MTSQAKKAARDLADGAVWIDHAALADSDLEWLQDCQRLTLWNVTAPPNFLAGLPNLWWVDWRGGGVAQRVGQVSGCEGLKYLALNQIRGLADLSFLAGMTSLEMIRLYGLTHLEQLPSLEALSKLRRAEIGQMKSMASIGPLLQAPNLEELQLHNFVRVSPADVVAMRRHPKLRTFEWFGENIPDKMWVPVREAVALPKTRTMHPEEWFDL